MIVTLMDAVRRHAKVHADARGVWRTPIEGLVTRRALMPGVVDYTLAAPHVCLVLQGAQRSKMGDKTYEMETGDTALVTAHRPMVSEVTRASEAAPFLSLSVTLDPAVIAGLVEEVDGIAGPAAPAMVVEPTHAEVADAVMRLVRLLERPASVRVLQGQLIRELHYWLLTGPNGGALRSLGVPDPHTRRILRAIALLRAEFDQPIPVDRMAAVAEMSPSSFRQHFRAATTLSPLQFQKHLRLIEARRAILADGMSASRVAIAVGYESVPQFTREYRRMFGLPPTRDREAALCGGASLALA